MLKYNRHLQTGAFNQRGGEDVFPIVTLLLVEIFRMAMIEVKVFCVSSNFYIFFGEKVGSILHLRSKNLC